MSIADYEFPTKTIPIDPTNSFRVRGISFTNLVHLAHEHGPTLGLIYSRAAAMVRTEKDQQTGEETPVFPSSQEIGQLLMTLAQEFPALVTDIIALASGELEGARGLDPKYVQMVKDKISQLPPGVTIEALYEIVALTIIGEHEIKKVLEIVTKAAENLTTTVTAVTGSRPALSNGNGAFVSG